ncbi:MAG: M48 family metalloprotease [Labilithrix sp.]|nr:M48 family metalloprotease [Labilithrix sp.]
MTRTLRSLLAAIAFAAALPVIAGCTTNPATGQSNFTPFMTPAQEVAIGRQEHPKVIREFGVYDEKPELNAYVAEIAFRLHSVSEMSDQPFTFTLLDSDMANAFAIPGGYVYITRGLMALANNEAELAGVIGHEIGHVTGRHSAQRSTQQIFAGLGAAAVGVALGNQAAAQVANMGALAWVQGYSRSQEMEADQLGIRYLTRAGYDPMAMASFLEQLGRETALSRRLLFQEGQATPADSWFSTHPRTEDRVVAAAQSARATVSNPRVGRDDYLRRIDGMIYGDSPQQGYVRGRTFAHPTLRLAFEVPQGFRMINGNTNVIAIDERGAQIVFDGDQAPQGMAMTDYIVNRWLEGRRPDGLERIDVNGMQGATGNLRLDGRNGPVDVRFVAVRWDGETVYRFLFVTPANITASYSEPFRRTSYSLRRLSTGEAQALRPLRLSIVEVRAGDTVESLSRRMAFDDFRRERFMVLNGLDSEGQLRPGMLVKIVVEG